MPEIGDETEEIAQNVKIIGKPMSAIRRLLKNPKRRSGPKKPKDGDGDGFYSLFPGAPDETPVPPESDLAEPSSVAMAIERGNLSYRPVWSRFATNEPPDPRHEEALGKRGSEVFTLLRDLQDNAQKNIISGGHPADKSLENVRNARNFVYAKYGPLETVKDCIDAFKKAYPNAEFRILGKRLKGSDQASETLKGGMIGLLFMASLDPETAKSIKVFSNYPLTPKYWKTNTMGLTQAGMGSDGFGTKISLDLNGREKYDKQFEKIAYLLQKKQQFWSANDYAQWMRFREHADSLKELENLPEQERLEEQKILEEDLVEDLQLINAFGDAVHEFGHAMHATATMKHMGIDPEDDTLTVVNKILGENFQDEDEALRSLMYRTGHYAYTPLEFLERATQAVFGKSKSPYSKWFMAEWEKFYDVEGEEEPKISLLSFFLTFRELYGVDQESLRKKFDVFDHGHDDLPAEEVRKSVRQAKLISEYGGKDLQGLEAVAEWVTFRVLTGQYKTGENGPTWRELRRELEEKIRVLSLMDIDPKFESITDQTFLNWATGGKIKQQNDDDFNEFVIQNFCTGELAESAGIVSDPKKLAEFRNGAKPSRKKRVILSKQLLGQIDVSRPVNEVKIIGTPIGGPNKPHDGDGDGMYTAVRGGEDNTPMPPDAITRVVVTPKGKRRRKINQTWHAIKGPGGQAGQRPNADRSGLDILADGETPEYLWRVISAEAWKQALDTGFFESTSGQQYAGTAPRDAAVYTEGGTSGQRVIKIRFDSQDGWQARQNLDGEIYGVSAQPIPFSRLAAVTPPTTKKELFDRLEKVEADLPEGGGLEGLRTLPSAHVKGITDRLKRIGLTREAIRSKVERTFLSATPDQIENGKIWYRRVNQAILDFADELSERFGEKYAPEKVAGVIAALSSRTEIVKNVRDAKKLIRALLSDDEFEIDPDFLRKLRDDKDRPQRWVKNYASLAGKRNGKLRPSDFSNEDYDLLAYAHPALNGFGSQDGVDKIVKAIDIHYGASIDETLSGPKIRSFYSNLVNPDGDRVTIDRWALRGMLPMKRTDAKQEKTYQQINDEKDGLSSWLTSSPNPVAKTGLPTGIGLYPLFADIMIQLAKKYDLSPAQMQAILWEIARGKSTSWTAIEKAFDLDS